MIEKRKRGRPRGTGQDDTAHLRQIADILIEAPTLKPTTAMHRVIAGRKWAESDTALIRRWQTKWKAEGKRYLTEARQARDARRAREAQVQAPVYVGGAISGFPLVATSVIGRALLAASQSPGTDLLRVGKAVEALNARSLASIVGPTSNIQRVGAAVAEMERVSRALDQQNRVFRQMKAYEDALRPIRQYERMMKTLKLYGV